MATIHLLSLALALTNAPAANDLVVFPGSPAPKLEIKRWLKGKEVTSIEQGTYVVEFWATWCGPCIQSIPHITELAKKNPDVTFIGVGIWEDDNGSVLDDFVKKMGDKMDYNVAYSGNKDGMAVSWMNAAKQNGIPSSFIVKDNVIQWVGHPMSMDAALAKVKSGENDVAAEKASFMKSIEAQEKQTQLFKALDGAKAKYRGGDKAGAKSDLSKIESEAAFLKPAIQSIKLEWMAEENPAGFKTEADKMVKENPQGITNIASICASLASNAKTKKIAVETIDKYAAKNKENYIFNYYAVNTYLNAGEKAKANKLAKNTLKMIEAKNNSELDQMKGLFKSLVEKSQ